MATKTKVNPDNTSAKTVTVDNGYTVEFEFKRPTRLGRLELNALYNVLIDGLKGNMLFDLAVTSDVDLYCMCSYSQSVKGLRGANGEVINFPLPNDKPEKHINAFGLLMQIDDDLFTLLSKEANTVLKTRFADPTLLPDSQLTPDQQSDEDLKKSESGSN